MKEKTFQELMHNKFDALEHYGGFKLSTKQQNAILELMQQVRESTKKEIMQLAIKDFGIVSAIIFNKHIESLPTDRILTNK